MQDNSTNQSGNPFLTNEEPTASAQEVSQAPAAEPAKKNGLTVVVVIMAVVIIGLIVAVIVLLGQNKALSDENEKLSKENNEMSSKISDIESAEAKQKEEEQKLAQRNTQREDDLMRFMTAVNSYQSNNNGKTPFADGEIYAKFVSRYIDADCLTSDGKKYTECGDEFKEPGGKTYSFASPINLTENLEHVLRDYEDVDYTIHVFTTAQCDEEGDSLLKSNGVRNVAFVMRLEGDNNFACVDNH